MPRAANTAETRAREQRIFVRLARGDRRADIARDEDCDPALIRSLANRFLCRRARFRRWLQGLIDRLPPADRALLNLSAWPESAPRSPENEHLAWLQSLIDQMPPEERPQLRP